MHKHTILLLRIRLERALRALLAHNYARANSEMMMYVDKLAALGLDCRSDFSDPAVWKGRLWTALNALGGVVLNNRALVFSMEEGSQLMPVLDDEATGRLGGRAGAPVSIAPWKKRRTEEDAPGIDVSEQDGGRRRRCFRFV